MPRSKSVLDSAAQTKNSTGLKIYTYIVLTLVGDQKVFPQPFQYWNFLYQGGFTLVSLKQLIDLKLFSSKFATKLALPSQI